MLFPIVGFVVLTCLVVIAALYRQVHVLRGKLHDYRPSVSGYAVTRSRINLVDLESKVTWNTFGEGVMRLSEELERDGFIPEVILGVYHGGVAIADILGVMQFKKKMATMGSTGLAPLCGTYKGEISVDRHPEEHQTRLLPDWVRGKKVLIVEDFFEKGETLNNLIEKVKEQEPGEIRLMLFAVPPRAVTPTGIEVRYEIDGRSHPIHYCYGKYPNNFVFEMPYGRVYYAEPVTER